MSDVVCEQQGLTVKVSPLGCPSYFPRAFEEAVPSVSLLQHLDHSRWTTGQSRNN